jgi:hypothetical protein
MKSAILLLSLLMFSGNKTRIAQPYTVNYIEIKHTGMEDYRYSTILISKEKLNVKLKKSWLDDRPLESLTDKQIDIITNFYYRRFVTDSITFSVMARFITESKQYYTNGKRVNWGDWKDYSITLNGKCYDIYYKTSFDYFRELLKYLKENNCDKQIIDSNFEM